MKRYISRFLCLCLAVLLCVPAYAATYSGTDPDFPTQSSGLYFKQLRELEAFADTDTFLVVSRDAVENISWHDYAWDYWGTHGTPDWVTRSRYLLIFYNEATNEAALAYNDAVREILTDEDIAAVEAAFAAPASDVPYVHVVNGIKQLLICVFDGGELEIPDYTYSAEYLRDPDSELDNEPQPSTRIIVAEDRMDGEKEIQCVYLADEISRYAGITVNIVQLPLDDETAAETAEGYRLAADPDATLALALDTKTGESAASIGEAVKTMLPDDAESRLLDAMDHTEGDDYDRAIAALEELARMLFAGGTREYGEFSGIALALDPDAFAESTGVPAAVWVALAVVLAAAIVLAVLLRRRKKRPE